MVAILRDGGLPVTEADNVLPDIGRLAPDSARAAIRAVFLEHVIGGDRLSTDPRLRQWVTAVTPDAVLEGVTVVAGETAGGEAPGVVVLDVGGATTDVYCVPDPDAEQATLGREAVGVPARRRTVEGDLGVSWSVEALRAAAAAEGLPLPGDDPLALGEAAATVALRRHLRAEAAYGAGGASARAAGLVVLSGGVFRHAEPAAVDAVVARLSADAGGAGSVVSDTAGRRGPELRACRGRAAGRRAPGGGRRLGSRAARRRRHVSGRVMTENSAPNGSVIVAIRP